MRKKESGIDVQKGNLTWQTVTLVALIIGFSFWFGMMYESQRSYDPNLEALEGFYDAAMSGKVPYVHRFINENTTIGDARRIYESMKPMSSALAEYQLRQVCAGVNEYD